MARKKPSGAQRGRLALLMRAMKNGPLFARGRPEGVTERREKLQEQLRKELAWLGMPYKSDLELAKLLSTPSLRNAYHRSNPDGPLHPHGAATYKGIKPRTFHREIAIAQHYVWGGPKVRGLPLQLKDRLNNFGQKIRPR